MPAIVHVKKRLTDLSVRFPNEQQYCGADFFPQKKVEHLTDQILKWNKANLLRLDELAMSAPDDELPPEVELILNADDAYQCRVYAIRAADKIITKRNADPAMDFDVERTYHIKQRLDVRLEYLRVKQVLRNTAIMTNNQTLTAAQQFDNVTSSASTPVSLGRAVVTQMRHLNGGNAPNVVRMSSFTKTAIIMSPEFKDVYKFAVASKGQILGDEAAIENVWGLPAGSVKVCDAVYSLAAPSVPPTTAAQSATGPSRAFIGSDIIFGYIQPPGLRTYGLGAEFRFSGYNTDPYAIVAVPQFNRGALPGEDLRAICITDPHVFNADSGYLLKGCVNTASATYNGLLD